MNQLKINNLRLENNNSIVCKSDELYRVKGGCTGCDPNTFSVSGSIKWDSEGSKANVKISENGQVVFEKTKIWNF